MSSDAQSDSNKSIKVTLKDGHTMTINFEWCKRCGICMAFCPKEVYELNSIGQPNPVHTEKCIVCLQCVYRCPDFAIDITKTVEDLTDAVVAVKEEK